MLSGFKIVVRGLLLFGSYQGAVFLPSVQFTKRREFTTAIVRCAENKLFRSYESMNGNDILYVRKWLFQCKKGDIESDYTKIV